MLTRSLFALVLVIFGLGFARALDGFPSFGGKMVLAACVVLVGILAAIQRLTGR
jgi:hypothetical protein